MLPPPPGRCVYPAAVCDCSVFAVVLNVLTAQSLGLYLGAAVMNPKTAQTIASVIMLAFMLVGGYYVRVSVWFLFNGGGRGAAGPRASLVHILVPPVHIRVRRRSICGPQDCLT